MAEYRKIFEGLVSHIEEDEKREILHTSFGGPAEPELLSEIKRRYFHGLSSPVLDFYEQMDGMQLVWDYRKERSSIPEFFPLLFLYKDVRFDGVINMLPLEILFNQEIWKGTVWFENDSEKRMEFLGEETTFNRFRQSLLPFDFFSTDMSMALYAGTRVQVVFLLQDYHIDYDDSLITYFEDYMSFLIASEGASGARYKVFNSLNGYRKPIKRADQLVGEL